MKTSFPPWMIVALLVACLTSASVMVAIKALPSETLDTMLKMLMGGALALLPARDASRYPDSHPAPPGGTPP